ncbi:hypothetical protein HID58_069764 [Brassica napus]|uniref:Uncharacterized protein n=1 Tax=Brassica napus TaxID=3708 RepID=A0ABQ7YWT8_BRANA|nr:hypothetical protein HID58_069764 [Brassica napus]
MASVYPCIFYFVSSSRLQAVFPLIFRIVAAAPLIPATLSYAVLAVAPPLKVSGETRSAQHLCESSGSRHLHRSTKTDLVTSSTAQPLTLPPPHLHLHILFTAAPPPSHQLNSSTGYSTSLPGSSGHSSFNETSRQARVGSLASVYRVHIAQSRDVMLDLVSLLCQISQASRDYTISAPLLMNIRAKFRQKRPFPTALGYGSRVIQLLLPTKSFRESSIEKLGQDLSAMFLSVTYTLSEVKESLSSSVLVSTNHLQTRCSGSPVVGSYPDFSMFFGTSVSGSKVKHLYGYLHPFNTSIVLIVVFFVYCLAVEITSGSGCNRLPFGI